MGAHFHAFMSMLVTVTVCDIGAQGAWTKGFSYCWGVSKVYGCPKLNDPENGHVSVNGKTASYTCEDNYTLIGDSRRTCFCARWQRNAPECVSDGQWTAWSEWTSRTKTCGTSKQRRQRTCRLPDSRGKHCVGEAIEERTVITERSLTCPALVNNHIALGLPISYVSTVSSSLVARLTCPKGYKLVGLDDGKVDCLDDDINSNPTCRKVCPDLADPLYGRVRIFDDIAAYECKAGFRIIGSARRRCSDGVWTGVAPNCSQNVSTIGELNGINPDILFGELGKTEFSGPSLLLPNCEVTATFQYRARSAREAIILRARLLNARDGDTELAEAIAVLPTDMGNTQTSCIRLDCSQSGLDGGVVGVVVLTPELEISETLTIKSVRFDPNQRCAVDFKAGPCPAVKSVTNAPGDLCKFTCQTDSDCKGDRERCCFNGCGLSCEVTTPNTIDFLNACESLPCQNRGSCEAVFFGYICNCKEGFTGLNCEYREAPGRRQRSAEGILVGDCDNSTESGDCGYRNSGCSVEPWALTIADDGNDDLMDDELAPLQYERPTEDCHFHVCVPCLLQSGFNVTSISPTPTSPTGRRRRSQFNPNGKAFCMRGGNGVPKFGEYFTNDVQLFDSSSSMLDDTKLFSFEYNMRSEGIHHLMIYAKCKSLSHHIHVGLENTVFGIPHFDWNVGKSGRVCVSLHPYISDVSGFSATTCSYFQIYIQAIGIGRKVCIEDLRFHATSELSSSFCPTIANN